MQEQSTWTLPKEEIINMLEDMEEEGSIVKKMWHSTIYSDTSQHRRNSLKGS